MKKKHSIQKDLLFIAISSFVVTAAWVGFNVYHEWATSKITPELQVQITPITPSFDITTINNLKNRRVVQPIAKITKKTVVQPTPGLSDAAADEQVPLETSTITPAQLISPTPLPVSTRTPANL